MRRWCLEERVTCTELGALNIYQVVVYGFGGVKSVLTCQVHSEGLYFLVFTNEMLCEVNVKIVSECISPSQKFIPLYLEDLVEGGEG